MEDTTNSTEMSQTWHHLVPNPTPLLTAQWSTWKDKGCFILTDIWDEERPYNGLVEEAEMGRRRVQSCSTYGCQWFDEVTRAFWPDVCKTQNIPSVLGWPRGLWGIMQDELFVLSHSSTMGSYVLAWMGRQKQGVRTKSKLGVNSVEKRMEFLMLDHWRIRPWKM